MASTDVKRTKAAPNPMGWKNWLKSMALHLQVEISLEEPEQGVIEVRDGGTGDVSVAIGTASSASLLKRRVGWAGTANDGINWMAP